MTQLFNLSIGAVLQKVSNISLSNEVNRFYNIATFNMDTEPQHELDVIINYGDSQFKGFVYATKKISKSLYSIECRTYGAKLTEPYSAYTEGYDEALTSHELCSLYATTSGIPINITAGNLDFGGSYERTGTMLSALQNIASTTGAEYWDDGTSIQIQPNKAITITGTEIAPSDIFDFVGTKSTVYNKGVGFITVQNGGSESTDIISKNNIYAEVDECTGEIFIYPNPYGAIEHLAGISALSAIKVDRTETNSMLDVDVVNLDGAIDSVVSVTLNGTEISDYNFVQGHNVIYFNTIKRGTLTVVYQANAYHGYTSITLVPIGRFITFDVFYLDQLLRFEGLLSPDCAVNTATDGDMVCIVPSDTYYNMGFDVWTIGGDPEFAFYDGSTEIIRNVVSTEDQYVSVESATIVEDAGTYTYKTRYNVVTALGAMSGTDDISYTIVVDGDDYYFSFSQYYPNISVSYETTSLKHHVEFAEILNGDVSMVIRNKNTDQLCEYQLDTKIPCELNQYIYVDVAAELGIEVVTAIGTTLEYSDPSNTANYVVVNSFGSVKIWVGADGDYVIDTGNLKSRTTITLTSNVFG